MKMTFLLLSISILLLTSSCQQNLIGFLRKGSYKTTERSVVEVPFYEINNLMIVELRVNGRPYKFLVDTGAVNVVSEEVASELHLNAARTFNTNDSQGRKNKLNYVQLREVKIGDAIFENTVAAVADLKFADAIACLGIDGILGANLMRKAIWEFDMERKVIRILESDKDLMFADGYLVNFNSVASGSPYVEFQLGSGSLHKVEVDTGSAGFLSTNLAVREAAKKSGEINGERVHYGSSTVGLFGAGPSDSMYVSRVSSLNIGTMSYPNQVVDFKKGDVSLLGMSFMKQFNFSFNWNSRLLVLKPHQDELISDSGTFGFAMMRQGNQMVITSVSSAPDVVASNLQVGDVVLRVNDIDLTSATLEQYCEILQFIYAQKSETVCLVLLRNGIKDEVVINRSYL